MKCATNKELISKFIDAELDGKTSAELERHIRTCDSCRTELQEMKRNDRLVASAFEGHPFDRALAGRIARRVISSRPATRRTMQYALAAAAACVAVALCLVIFSGPGVAPKSGTNTAALTEYTNDSHFVKRTNISDHVEMSVQGGTSYALGSKGKTVLIHLRKGQVFLSAAPGRDSDIVVITPEATFRPIGTRFDVYRLFENGKSYTWLSVIEGKVEVETAKTTRIIVAGEQARVSSTGKVKIARTGSARVTAEWALEPVAAPVNGPINPPVIGPEGPVASPPANNTNIHGPNGGNLDTPAIPPKKKKDE